MRRATVPIVVEDDLVDAVLRVRAAHILSRAALLQHVVNPKLFDAVYLTRGVKLDVGFDADPITP